MFLLLPLLFYFMHRTATNVIHSYSHLGSYSHTSLYFTQTCTFKWLLSLCFMERFCPSLISCIAHWFYLIKLSDPQTWFAPGQYLTLMEIQQQIPRSISENLSFGIIITFCSSFYPGSFCLKSFYSQSLCVLLANAHSSSFALGQILSTAFLQKAVNLEGNNTLLNFWFFGFWFFF